MLCEPDTYIRDLLENLDTLEAVIHKTVITYGILRMKENEVDALKVNGKQLNEEILHEHEIKKSFKLQSQDVQINPVQAVDDNLIVSKSSWIESKNNNELSKSHWMLGRLLQKATGQSQISMIQATVQGIISHVVDADIRPVNDQVPFVEVQLTAQHNVLAKEQQHTEQSKPIYDTYLLKKVVSNTTPDSTNMCHRGG
ncbi:hypothetical protein Tco_0650931 [Tanacetum coccineum]